MEALVAVGLASNVVQFVDFGFKLFSRADEIRKRGSTTHAVDLRAISLSIDVISRDLQHSLEYDLATCKTPLEQALEEVTLLASDLAGDLQVVLNELKMEPNQSRWRSFSHALKISWSSEKTEALFQRLLHLRDQLEIHVLMKLRDDIELIRIVQTQQFEEQSKDLQAISEAIITGQNLFTGELEDQFQKIRNEHVITRNLAETHHQETLDAIRKGPVKRWGNARLDEQALGGFKDLRSLRESKRSSAHEFLLEELDFTRKYQRERDVAEAHAETFHWLLGSEGGKVSGSIKANSQNWISPNIPSSDQMQMQSAEQVSSTAFIDWLRFGTGCFWINGKAASGKSTLMKYLSNNQRLSANLKTWSGQESLHIISFYFWNSGTDLQKKQEGLLRAILHSAISDYPDLAELCFADSIQDALSRVKHIRDDPCFDPLTDKDLRQAFTRLLERPVDHHRFCFLIDGVDEYEGSVAELCELLKTITVSTTCKAILSSRPIPPCVEAFQSFPTFRLQDLTRSDILAYVQDNLHRHSRFQEMSIEEPLSTKLLIDVMVEKSSGVFLWVILTTRSVLDGLSNFDSIRDLQERIDAYPPELHGLYKHMLGRMDDLYKTQSSQLLQIVYNRSKLRCVRALTVKQLCCDLQPAVYALQSRSDARSAKDFIQRCGRMEGLVRSRCCGLIEIGPPTPILTTAFSAIWGSTGLNLSRNARIADSEVQFLHKTVVDFLEEPEVWAFILGLCGDATFDVNTSLVASSIYVLKDLPREEILESETSEIISYAEDCLFFARRAENMSHSPQTLYLRELDCVMRQHWAGAKYWTPSMDWARRFDRFFAWSSVKTKFLCSEGERLRTSGYWTIIMKHNGTFLGHEECFEALAVAYDLRLYLQDTLALQVRKDGTAFQLSELLEQVMLNLIDREGDESEGSSLSTLTQLLDLRANPQKAWTTLCTFLSVSTSPYCRDKLPYAVLAVVIKELARAGAQLNLQVEQSNLPGWYTLSHTLSYKTSCTLLEWIEIRINSRSQSFDSGWQLIAGALKDSAAQKAIAASVNTMRQLKPNSAMGACAISNATSTLTMQQPHSRSIVPTIEINSSDGSKPVGTLHCGKKDKLDIEGALLEKTRTSDSFSYRLSADDVDARSSDGQTLSSRLDSRSDNGFTRSVSRFWHRRSASTSR